MKKLALLLLLYSVPLTAQTPCAEFDVGAASTVRLVNLCNGSKIWRLGNDYMIVCPGAQRPPGSIEMREFYQIGDRAQ